MLPPKKLKIVDLQRILVLRIFVNVRENYMLHTFESASVIRNSSFNKWENVNERL